MDIGQTILNKNSKHLYYQIMQFKKDREKSTKTFATWVTWINILIFGKERLIAGCGLSSSSRWASILAKNHSADTLLFVGLFPSTTFIL